MRLCPAVSESPLSLLRSHPTEQRTHVPRSSHGGPAPVLSTPSALTPRCSLCLKCPPSLGTASGPTFSSSESSFKGSLFQEAFPSVSHPPGLGGTKITGSLCQFRKHLDVLSHVTLTKITDEETGAERLSDLP